MVTLVVVMYAVVIFSDGSKLGQVRRTNRKDTDLQEVLPTPDDSHMHDSWKEMEYSVNKKVRKAHPELNTKRRKAKRKKFKHKSMRGKAKSRKIMKLRTSGNHTLRNNQEKKKPKSLALKRSKTQTKTIQNLETKTERDQETDCGECDQLECPTFDAMVKYCPSGVVKDKCGCCAQCASSVGMPCYTSNSPLKWTAPCGNDLECLPATMRGSDIKQARRVWGSKVSLEGNDILYDIASS